MNKYVKAGLYGLLTLLVLSVISVVGIFTLTDIENRRIERQSPTVASEDPGRVSAQRLMKDVEWLAAPQREGRFTGDPGASEARDWLVSQFQYLGLPPAGNDGYLQDWQATYKGKPMSGANVLASLPGSAPDLPVIVISAHYDHLGIKAGRLYPGADDNASGTAGVLELARWFVLHPPRHTLLFALFDGEEEADFGSEAFVKDPPLPWDAIGMDVNLDMVARADDNIVFAVGTWDQPWLKPVIENVQGHSTVKILFGHDRPIWVAGLVENWIVQSDQASFAERDKPYVYFGVPDHPDYHQPTDTPDRIDPARYASVVDAVLETVIELDTGFDTFPRD